MGKAEKLELRGILAKIDKMKAPENPHRYCYWSDDIRVDELKLLAEIVRARSISNVPNESSGTNGLWRGQVASMGQRVALGAYSRTETAINWTREGAERWLLGAMLLAPDQVVSSAFFHEYLFAPGPNRTIHSALEWLYQGTEPITAVTVIEYLKAHGQLEEVGGAAAIIELQSDCPMIGWADQYEKFLEDNPW